MRREVPHVAFVEARARIDGAAVADASSFCLASPTTSMANSKISDVERPTARVRPSEEAATALTEGDLPDWYDLGAQCSSRSVSATLVTES